MSANARLATDAPGYRAQMARLVPLPEDPLAAVPARGDVCGRDIDHTLSPVDELPGGGTAYECVGCPYQVVIEPDGTNVPVDVYEMTL